ncbi:hypothetical protein RUM43_006025 [Polyplax serrata]|uniref:CUB domain-containing protein n=1 Tax=Polyplax serrata TaxID=468196 RepID=A0AAN8PAG8_POLSC
MGVGKIIILSVLITTGTVWCVSRESNSSFVSGLNSDYDALGGENPEGEVRSDYVVVKTRSELPGKLLEVERGDKIQKIQLLDYDGPTRTIYLPSNIVLNLGSDVSSETYEKRDETLPRNNYQMSSNTIFKSYDNTSLDFKKWPDDRAKRIIDTNGAKSFGLIPALVSLYPINWMTKIRNFEGLDMSSTSEKSDNLISWLKLKPINKLNVENRIQTSVESTKPEVEHKFPTNNLKFDNVACDTTEGLQGTCLHQSECEKRGGKFNNTCAREHGVCCYTEKTCGDHSSENSTYFVSQDFHKQPLNGPAVCTLTLNKMNSNVQQLRVELVDFELKDPTNGACLDDRLVITGQDNNKIIPVICGSNSGQHDNSRVSVYVDVDDSDGPYTLSVITSGEYLQRSFRMKILHLKPGDEMLAPKFCLQYHTGITGILEIFNYKRNSFQVTAGYFNNLNYAICIKKGKGYCTISFENFETDPFQPTFQMVNVDEEGQRLLPPQQAGAETFDCPDDYITVGGMRLCGEKLNDGRTDVDLQKNFPITDSTNGPFILHVKTDASETGRGFYLSYTQHPCLV